MLACIGSVATDVPAETGKLRLCITHLGVFGPSTFVFAPYRAPGTLEMTAATRLSREVRFSLCPGGGIESTLNSPRSNTHVGWPTMSSPGGTAWRAVIEVEGIPNHRTGYLVGIDRIDAAVRAHALPRLLERQSSSGLDMSEALDIVHQAVSENLDPRPSATMLSIEPMTWWRIESSSMSTLILRRRYEFSASHRLHLPELDEAANAELFGKCSNLNGHGHNYEVEVQVACDREGETISVHRLDEVVDRVIIDRFDHKHLNLDVDDFRDRVASVENIAARCVELLRDPIHTLPGTPRLDAVTVWETPRTACTASNSSP
ncbi:MAG: hypothetical protein CMJ34_11630 [Phycisphaerae bacterium]|nr:hypothetical protein [Phycisphaerae bacterium]